MMVRGATLVLLAVSLVLTACSGPSRRADVTSRVSLYGIALGQARGDIDEEHTLYGCQDTPHVTRCMVNIDTRGASGPSAAETTTLFLTFKQGTVTIMSFLVFDHALDHATKELIGLYGTPEVTPEKSQRWRVDDDEIVLSFSSSTSEPSVVTYRDGRYLPE